MKRKFRISIEVDGGMTLFDSTNSQKQVDEFVSGIVRVRGNAVHFRERFFPDDSGQV